MGYGTTAWERMRLTTPVPILKKIKEKKGEFTITDMKAKMITDIKDRMAKTDSDTVRVTKTVDRNGNVNFNMAQPMGRPPVKFF